MLWIRIAALSGFAGVALGAFGAHALRSRITPELLAAWQTGVLYHLLHAVALLALALYARSARVDVAVPASLFLAGIVLFSGSLYALALLGGGKIALVTPFGGLALLAGWVALSFVVVR